MPSVTVLMPVYNAQSHLRQAIDSILAQTYTDFEFLIINDCSTDSSREIITSYADPRIRLVDNERHLGLTVTLNRGLQLAEGDLIARQDADDLSHPRRLEKQARFLQNHPEVSLLGSQGRVIDQQGNYLGPLDRSQNHVSIRWYLLFDNSFIHTSVVFRRKVVWDELSGYDEAFSYCQDYDLWSKIVFDYSVSNLADRLVDYRGHSSSQMSTTMRAIGSTEAQRVIGRNLYAVFGERAFTNDEIELISRFRLGIEEMSFKTFMDLFHRLLEQYEMLYPDTAVSRDFKRTVARQFDNVAYGLVPPNRGFAISVYAEAIRHHPALVFFLPWAGVLALTVLGKKGRGSFGRIRRYRLFP